jgi:DNA repair protein RadC
MLEVTLFDGGERAQKPARRKKEEKYNGYYWVTTRLLRESGPWYCAPIKGADAVVSMVNEYLDLENADREHFYLYAWIAKTRCWLYR